LQLVHARRAAGAARRCRRLTGQRPKGAAARAIPAAHSARGEARTQLLSQCTSMTFHYDLQTALKIHTVIERAAGTTATALHKATRGCPCPHLTHCSGCRSTRLLNFT
jgi:hypothetical protein